MKKLSHVDPGGTARMVDVSAKKQTPRTASARAFVSMSEKVQTAIVQQGLAKGDALGVARLAGVMAAKKTPELIPLCHPISLSDIDVDVSLVDGGVEVVTRVRTTDRTGVEMEALVAASVAALTIYDMCKALDKGIRIERVELLSKSGGRSGSWKRGK